MTPDDCAVRRDVNAVLKPLWVCGCTTRSVWTIVDLWINRTRGFATRRDANSVGIHSLLSSEGVFEEGHIVDPAFVDCGKPH